MLCPIPYKLSKVPPQPVQITLLLYKFYISKMLLSTNYNMDQQGKYTKAEILDLSENFSDFYCDSNNWLSSTLDSQKVKAIENHTRERHQMQNKNILGVPVSAEELKIRSELEMEIERDLEEEIKENIYHLAFRLHRIYQNRKQRNVKEASESGNQPDKRNRALSEVNISIRMEGGTKIEIKEVNNEAAERGYQRNSRAGNEKEVHAFSAKKFDWVKTLRAGSGPVSVNRANGSSKQKDRMLSTDPNLYLKCKIDSTRGKHAGSSGQGKRNASMDNKMLQLGWKV